MPWKYLYFSLHLQHQRKSYAYVLKRCFFHDRALSMASCQNWFMNRKYCYVVILDCLMFICFLVFFWKKSRVLIEVTLRDFLDPHESRKDKRGQACWKQSKRASQIFECQLWLKYFYGYQFLCWGSMDVILYFCIRFYMQLYLGWIIPMYNFFGCNWCLNSRHAFKIQIQDGR